jgi:hypothetical protein
MKSRVFFYYVITILLIAAGCESNDPSLNKLKVDMVAENSASARMLSGGRIATESDTVIFNSFLLGVTEISLKGKEYGKGRCDNDNDDDQNHESDEDSDDQDGESSKNKWEVEGEFVVDVLAGTSTPDMSADLPPDSITFHKMEIEFGPVLPDSNSVYINAHVIRGDDTLKVEFATKRKFEIHLKRKHGIEVSPTLDKLLVAFSIDKLFSGIDWSKAKVSDDGVIRLSDPANAYLGYKVKYNFYRLMRWGRDKNHDHRMDDHDDD